MPKRPWNSNLASILRRTGIYLILFMGALSMLLPFLWMVSTSVKPNTEIFSSTPALMPRNPTLSHYVEAVSSAQFGRFFFNSTVVTAIRTGLTAIVASMAGYAFSRLRFRGRDTLFLMLLGTLMIPFQLILIPTFITVKHIPFAGGNDVLGRGGIGWINTYWGLSIPGVVSAFDIFLFRQFFSTLPKELEDAARVDGCSEFGIFSRIILPLSLPAILVVILLTFGATWNDFLWPLVVVQTYDMRTIQLGLAMFRTQHSVDWGILMAATTLSTLPTILVFLAAQRYFVKGIAMTGLKG